VLTNTQFDETKMSFLVRDLKKMSKNFSCKPAKCHNFLYFGHSLDAFAKNNGVK